MVMPFISLDRSLNSETNLPMLTPCWPRAGPTGGAGVAWPPGHCSLIWAVTCLAMSIDPHETDRRSRPEVYGSAFWEPLFYDAETKKQSPTARFRARGAF